MLVLLVVISLALLTDYFGESQNSPLHSVQRGIATVLSPLQSGASTVLSPVRDVAGYFSSTINAKSELKQVRSQNETLTREFAAAQLEINQLKQAGSVGKLDTSYSLSSYGLKYANVIGGNPLALVQDDLRRQGLELRRQAVRPGGGSGWPRRQRPRRHARRVCRSADHFTELLGGRDDRERLEP